MLRGVQRRPEASVVTAFSFRRRRMPREVGMLLPEKLR